MCQQLLDRFWWPLLDVDVHWYVKTCHECQVRHFRLLHVPPTVVTPAPLFQKVYMDVMLLPRAGGYRYLVQAQCLVTGWVEWRKLRSNYGCTIADFVYENILCRWGAVHKIVTNNGPSFLAGIDQLSLRYGINHIMISAYISQANGLVER